MRAHLAAPINLSDSKGRPEWGQAPRLGLWPNDSAEQPCPKPLTQCPSPWGGRGTAFRLVPEDPVSIAPPPPQVPQPGSPFPGGTRLPRRNSYIERAAQAPEPLQTKTCPGTALFFCVLHCLISSVSFSPCLAILMPLPLIRSFPLRLFTSLFPFCLPFSLSFPFSSPIHLSPSLPLSLPTSPLLVSLHSIVF